MKPSQARMISVPLLSLTCPLMWLAIKRAWLATLSYGRNHKAEAICIMYFCSSGQLSFQFSMQNGTHPPAVMISGYHTSTYIVQACSAFFAYTHTLVGRAPEWTRT
jgi:hypothetical protein